MAIISILLTFVSTLVGGLFGLKFKDKMHIVLGFTAGVLLAIVAFDIFPEIFEILESGVGEITYVMYAFVAGFLVFHIAEKLLLIHHSHEEEYGEHKHPSVGMLSALALSAHSFLDGLGIGLGFQISREVGLAVALAVIAHAFSDGLNNVALMLAHKNTKERAIKFLTFHACAPLLGGLSTFFFTLSSDYLLIYLGFFAGFLMYIGASDILPEAHSHGSSHKTIYATLVGVLFILLVSTLLG
ncbi:MAG: ZIP family metal transporter [Candidatus Vogelbacteria bacterium]|nr:ZIP family metal transporter [Candidatus Vogelbacteria bacterium]